MNMEPGYYWAEVFGETQIVEVFGEQCGTQPVKTFLNGWQDIEDIKFISKEPITI